VGHGRHFRCQGADGVGHFEPAWLETRICAFAVSVDEKEKYAAAISANNPNNF
jgi:hypothetical protein